MTAAAVLIGGLAPVRAQRGLEYEVKALYLSNFLQFVDWPAEVVGPPNTPFPVCVLGVDPFGPVLDRTMGRERVGDHPVTVRRIKDAADSTGCRLVFVAGDQASRQAVATVKRATTALVVGEAPRFLDDGGHINFVIAGGHVRFDIDFNGAKQSGLTVSSKLARIARQAIGEPDGR